MYLYRTVHNSFPSIKFSLWIFIMEISQQDMMSVPNILELHRMRLWKCKFHNTSSAFVKKLMDSFVIFMHNFSHLPTLHLALYTKNTASISTRCSLQIRKTQSISIPLQIEPNVWILTTESSTLTTSKSLICLGETTKFITVTKPIHILQLPPACSTTSPDFHLPPCYEHPALIDNISLDMANHNMVNISSLDCHIWQHLKDHRNETQLHHLSGIPSVPIAQLYKHMISGIKPITPFISPTESTADTELIWTLFSHAGVYVMATGSFIPASLGVFHCYFFWC